LRAVQCGPLPDESSVDEGGGAIGSCFIGQYKAQIGACRKVLFLFRSGDGEDYLAG
jgi:hypothetical protein